MNTPSSKHFKLEQLADGVYAAVHADGGWAISNAAIIDLGDRTLVFDTFLTPRAAEDLRQAAEALTGREVRLVVNSHFHNDHIWGNQVFSPEAEIISTVQTRLLIETEGAQEFAACRDNSARRLEAVKQQFATARTEAMHSDLSQWIVYYQALVGSIPELRIRIPNLTFKDRLVLHGPSRSAELISLGSAHTGNDSVLYLPQDGILFMSDLLFIGYHPYLGDGDPDGLLNALEQAGKFEAQVFVPGHGPAGKKADLDLMWNYIEKCRELARGLVERGEPVSAAAALPIPEPYQSWRFGMFFEDNIRFLYNRQA